MLLLQSGDFEEVFDSLHHDDDAAALGHGGREENQRPGRRGKEIRDVEGGGEGKLEVDSGLNQRRRSNSCQGIIIFVSCFSLFLLVLLLVFSNQAEKSTKTIQAVIVKASVVEDNLNTSSDEVRSDKTEFRR